LNTGKKIVFSVEKREIDSKPAIFKTWNGGTGNGGTGKRVMGERGMGNGGTERHSE
jgi:hypothetical protein